MSCNTDRLSAWDTSCFTVACLSMPATTTSAGSNALDTERPKRLRDRIILLLAPGGLQVGQDFLYPHRFSVAFGELEFDFTELRRGRGTTVHGDDVVAHLQL